MRQLVLPCVRRANKAIFSWRHFQEKDAREPSDNTLGWIGFFAHGTILSWLLSTFFRSLSSPRLVSSSLSRVTSATSLSPPSFHISGSGRIVSRKNYNCIKDISRLAHCSSIPRGVVPRRGISIDLAIDSLMESVQLRRQYSKIYRRNNTGKLSAKMLVSEMNFCEIEISTLLIMYFQLKILSLSDLARYCGICEKFQYIIRYFSIISGNEYQGKISSDSLNMLHTIILNNYMISLTKFSSRL